MNGEMNIEALCKWGKPREVPTKYGPKILRTCALKEGDPFWVAWKANKPALKAAGVSVGKKYGSDLMEADKWEACWWQCLSAEEVARREKSLEDSHATDAQVDFPKPDGLDYMPFQKAGIAYALARPGTIIGDEMGLGKAQPLDAKV